MSLFFLLFPRFVVPLGTNTLFPSFDLCLPMRFDLVSFTLPLPSFYEGTFSGFPSLLESVPLSFLTPSLTPKHINLFSLSEFSVFPFQPPAIFWPRNAGLLLSWSCSLFLTPLLFQPSYLGLSPDRDPRPLSPPVFLLPIFRPPSPFRPLTFFASSFSSV